MVVKFAHQHSNPFKVTFYRPQAAEPTQVLLLHNFYFPWTLEHHLQRALPVINLLMACRALPQLAHMNTSQRCGRHEICGVCNYQPACFICRKYYYSTAR